MATSRDCGAARNIRAGAAWRASNLSGVSESLPLAEMDLSVVRANAEWSIDGPAYDQRSNPPTHRCRAMPEATVAILGGAS